MSSTQRKRRHPVARVKGNWSDAEDTELRRLVRKLGEGQWAAIAKALNEHFDKSDDQGRIGKQCRERWNHHLRPGIKRDAWTDEEEAALVALHRQLDNRWSDIARQLPGRTENMVKNHWNATLRRRDGTQSDKGPHTLKAYMQERGLIGQQPSAAARTAAAAAAAAGGGGAAASAARSTGSKRKRTTPASGPTTSADAASSDPSWEPSAGEDSSSGLQAAAAAAAAAAPAAAAVAGSGSDGTPAADAAASGAPVLLPPVLTGAAAARHVRGAAAAASAMTGPASAPSGGAGMVEAAAAAGLLPAHGGSTSISGGGGLKHAAAAAVEPASWQQQQRAAPAPAKRLRHSARVASAHDLLLSGGAGAGNLSDVCAERGAARHPPPPTSSSSPLLPMLLVANTSTRQQQQQLDEAEFGGALVPISAAGGGLDAADWLTGSSGGLVAVASCPALYCAAATAEDDAVLGSQQVAGARAPGRSSSVMAATMMMMEGVVPAARPAAASAAPDSVEVAPLYEVCNPDTSWAQQQLPSPTGVLLPHHAAATAVAGGSLLALPSPTPGTAPVAGGGNEAAATAEDAPQGRHAQQQQEEEQQQLLPAMMLPPGPAAAAAAATADSDELGGMLESLHTFGMLDDDDTTLDTQLAGTPSLAGRDDGGAATAAAATADVDSSGGGAGVGGTFRSITGSSAALCGLEDASGGGASAALSRGLSLGADLPASHSCTQLQQMYAAAVAPRPGASPSLLALPAHGLLRNISSVSSMDCCLPPGVRAASAAAAGAPTHSSGSPSLQHSSIEGGCYAANNAAPNTNSAIAPPVTPRVGSVSSSSAVLAAAAAGHPHHHAAAANASAGSFAWVVQPQVVVMVRGEPLPSQHQVLALLASQLPAAAACGGPYEQAAVFTGFGPLPVAAARVGPALARRQLPSRLGALALPGSVDGSSSFAAQQQQHTALAADLEALLHDIAAGWQRQAGIGRVVIIMRQPLAVNGSSSGSSAALAGTDVSLMIAVAARTQAGADHVVQGIQTELCQECYAAALSTA